MQWYYSKNGTQLGPVAQGELLSKLATGEVAAADLVWREGMADWVPAGQVGELKVVGTGVPTSAGVASPEDGGPVSPYATPVSPPAVAAAAQIPSYLWQSIVATLFCCLPFGIVAIVYASKVDTLKARGDVAGAMAASASAKNWMWISFGVGLAFMVLYLLVLVFAGISGAQA